MGGGGPGGGGGGGSWAGFMPALEGIAIDGMPAICIFPWRLSEVVRRGAVTGMPGRRGLTVTVWDRGEGGGRGGKRDDWRRWREEGGTHTHALSYARLCNIQ